VIYWKGPVLRERSPFAQQLQSSSQAAGGRRGSGMPAGYSSNPGSRSGSRMGSRSASYSGGMKQRNTSQGANSKQHTAVQNRLAQLAKEQEQEQAGEKEL